MSNTSVITTTGTGLTSGGGGAAGGVLMVDNGAAVWNYNLGFVTDSNTHGNIVIGQVKGTKEIGATLYLKFVKSKLGKVQVAKVKKRMAKVQKLIAYSKEMGQRALYEALCEEVAVLIRESEMLAFGIDKYVDREHITKFINVVKNNTIKWQPLEKFPRVIPKKVQGQVKRLEKAGIFDELHILYIDYTGKELKTNKEKIKDKDPILFGKFAHQPNRFYFIADWVDEYCDLTLDKFVQQFKDEDPDFGVSKVEDITEDRWKAIVQEVKDRQKRLTETKPNNWRELEAKENATETTKLKETLVQRLVKKMKALFK